MGMFFIACGITLVLMAICRLVYNLLASAGERAKKERDKAAGVYTPSAPKNLKDRFK